MQKECGKFLGRMSSDEKMIMCSLLHHLKSLEEPVEVRFSKGQINKVVDFLISNFQTTVSENLQYYSYDE